MKTLHILNGDTTLHQFNQSDLKGDTFVWREILCEGKTVTDLRTELFWETRRTFLQSFVADFEPQQQQELKEAFFRLDFSNYDEVVFWFEYDLFCQVNLMALLSWVYASQVETTIGLVCVGAHPNYSKMVGLGEIQPNEFAALYDTRANLLPKDLLVAHEIWDLYCKGQHLDIIPAIRKGETTVFEYLEPAFFEHQKRFPNAQNGLNEIERQLLDVIQETPKSLRTIIGEMLRQSNFYGFGDLQYFKYLEGLAPLLEEREEQFFINNLGRQVLANHLNFQTIKTGTVYFGGATQQDYHWDNSQQQLFPSAKNKNQC